MACLHNVYICLRYVYKSCFVFTFQCKHARQHEAQAFFCAVRDNVGDRKVVAGYSAPTG